MTTHEEAANAFRRASTEFDLAERAWSAELSAQFGRHAGDVRYTPAGRGADGTHLRRLHDARDAARIAWEVARADLERAIIQKKNREQQAANRFVNIDQRAVDSAVRRLTGEAR